MKIAILVLAHAYKSQLLRLVQRLSPDFDVFVHLDKRSALSPADVEVAQNVRAFKEHRVYWGSYSMILATVSLLKAAARAGSYDRYLLISGQDVPIKDNEAIAAFFDANRTTEYIEYIRLPNPYWQGGGLDRVSRYHPTSTRGAQGTALQLLKLEHSFFKRLNMVLGERKIDHQFHGGANWFNLTGACVRGILDYLDANPAFLSRFKYTVSCDEIFMQTAIHNIGAGDSVVSSCLRYVDWNAGPEYPRILRTADYQKLVESDMLFARKFDDSVDPDIVEMLYALTSQAGSATPSGVAPVAA